MIGFIPERDMEGNIIVSPGLRKSKDGNQTGRIICSHCFGDQTTWYQRSQRVTDETVSSTGGLGLEYVSANNPWINIDSDRLTMDKNVVSMPDGVYKDHSDFRPVVKVDDVVQTSGFTVDYTNGKVTFGSSKAANTVKLSYSHINGVSRPSEFILAPPSGKVYNIEHIELQFSENTSFTPIRFQVWAGGSLGTYSDFNDTLYATYGQEETRFLSLRSFINVCNRGTDVIKASQNPLLSNDIMVFPLQYVYAAPVDSATASLMRFWIEDDTAFSNCELGTATFYLEVKNS